MVTARPEPARFPFGPFAPGELVAGAYEVRHILGAAGMGVVYDAIDVGLRRRVALKVALDATYAGALHAEAHALAALQSPSFALVYALAEHCGSEVVVMERLYGQRLDLRIEAAAASGAPLEIREIVDVTLGIARALATAHAAGISGLDVKPSNTVIVGERVALFDVGLATPPLLRDPAHAMTSSAEYLAPELVTGSVEPRGGAVVDLYALGVVAYELLTGATPFGGTAADVTLRRHVTEPVGDVRAARADVPDALAQLVHDLLQKAPKDRPGSAETVVWSLEQIELQCAAKARRSMSVVAVDADVRVARALKRRLESTFPRLSVDVATDPEPVIHPPPHRATADLLLLDLDLDSPSCVETCVEMLALPLEQRPAIVGMAAQTPRDDQSTLRALGVRDIVPKGADLLGSVSRVVARLREDPR